MPDIRDLKTAEKYIRLRRENREMQARIDALKKENAELRKKTEALDMLEEMLVDGETIRIMEDDGIYFIGRNPLYDGRLSGAIRAAYTAWKEGEE